MNAKVFGFMAFASLLFAVPKGADAQDNPRRGITVATYNVRVDVNSDAAKGDGWKTRVPKICDIILFNDIEIFGAQEVTKGQLDDMLALLPGFTYTGVGREDGAQKGEYSPVFYNIERFNLLDSGSFWLAPDYTKPNFGWDAACVRICSWGKFRDKRTRRVVWFFNTHLDHIGKEARRESARLILSKVYEISDGSDNVILTGDFNADQNSEPYKIIADSHYLSDSFVTAERKMVWGGSFTGFDPFDYNEKRIDHIFTGAGFIVRRYGILNDVYRSVENSGSKKVVKIRVPSDHNAIVARISFD